MTTTTGDARLNAPTRLRDGTEILDIDHYAPFLLNVVSSAWGRKTSAIYRRDFGLGLTDWRVISMLNIEPGITASRICDVVRLDKGAVSRSLKTLDDLGHLDSEQPSGDPRKRLWRLSEQGQLVHGRIMAVALGCEAELVSGITRDDLATTLRVLRTMLVNIDPK
ncbi:MarR family winged helix-turn-helix transcriptional regulator [Mesobacterium pallidum]|uniref:MarR family winged helix-turn-helix transcriptional regulator n=1 Tax=Mesobacterium pallidum TaxID=2872037 RepID=UPI001EE2D502|nr:MarR family winged helix-turn-helix transcriptional regulator [Mesobacterium pallidum]